MHMRLFGLTSLVSWLLAGYFGLTAQYLEGTAVVAADHALVTGLRVLAGACAIPACVFGLSFLNSHDAAIMVAQRAANGASDEPTAGPTAGHTAEHTAGHTG